MTSSDVPFLTYIHCGEHLQESECFNDQSNMDHFYNFLYSRLMCEKPAHYKIVFYNHMMKKFVSIDQELLASEQNPYRLYSSIGRSHLDFYVEEISDKNCLENGISSHELSFTELLSRDYNALPPTPNNNHLDQGSSSTLCLEDLFKQDTVEHTNLINNSSSGSIENLIIPYDLTKEIQQEDKELDRLIVSLDVNPYQKKRHNSDQQKIRQDTTDQKETKTTNGYLSRIQGIKAPDEKYKQVLPRISVPQMFLEKPNLKLIVHAVYEKIEDGMRMGYKDYNKGFLLPNQSIENAITINPIKIQLNADNVKNGIFILDLYMISKWDKTKHQPEKIYQIDEEAMKKLHPAKHEPNTTRLLCTLEYDNKIYWITSCLFDFIREPVASKRSLKSSTKGDTTSSTSKRAKTNKK